MSEVAVKSHAALQKEVLANLRVLGGKGIKDEDIIHEGTKFILPSNMTTAQAMRNLAKMVEALEQKTNFNRTFRYRPWDGAHATYQVLHRTFGSLGSKSQFSLFGGEKPPQLISFEVGPGQTAEVPWGILTIGAIPDAEVHLDMTEDKEFGSLFQISIVGPKRLRFEAEGIFKLIEQELETNSIYRGKAIDGAEMPSFLDLDGIDPRRVTYSGEVLHQLNANIWSLVEKTEDMRQLKLPLKRAVMLEGKYGTGKTLAAFLTAQKCVSNGWTFLYARPGKDDLIEVMRTARLYQPAVVFMEDMDVIPGANDESTTDNTDISKMLDLFDGINAKGTEIMMILTTNYIERITRGMLRPGRLDAIIHIAALDRTGIRRLLEANVEEVLRDSDIDWEKVADAMTGFMPAFVKEAGDRAIRYAIARGIDPNNIKLLTEDFVGAADGLRPQLELMNKEREAPEDTLEGVMVRTFQKAQNENGWPGTEKRVKEFHKKYVENK